MQTHAVVVHCTAQRRIKSSQNVTLGETPNKVISLTRLYENNSILYSLYTAESVLFVDISLSWFFFFFKQNTKKRVQKKKYHFSRLALFKYCEGVNRKFSYIFFSLSALFFYPRPCCITNLTTCKNDSSNLFDILHSRFGMICFMASYL